MKKRRKLSPRRRQALGASVANRKAPISIAPCPWDHGAEGQANRIGLVVEQRGEKNPATGKIENPNGVTGVRRRDLLEFWYNRGTISKAGYNAGDYLRAAYEATMRSPAALPDNDRVQSSPKPDQAVTIMIDRISAYSSVMGLVHDDDREIISRCVLDNWHPGRIQKYRGERSRQGFRHLRDALDRLSDALAKPRKLR